MNYIHQESSSSTTLSEDNSVDGNTPSTAPSTTTGISVAPSRPDVKIKYSLEVYDPNTRESLSLNQNDEPFEFPTSSGEVSGTQVATSDPPAIFEIVTATTGYDRRKRKGDDFFEMMGMGNDDMSTVQDEPLKLEHIKINRLNETRMEIHSSLLIEAIKEVVDYYPKYI